LEPGEKIYIDLYDFKKADLEKCQKGRKNKEELCSKMNILNACFLVGLLTCFQELFSDGLQQGFNPAKTVGKNDSVNYDLLRHNIPFRQSQKKFGKS